MKYSHLLLSCFFCITIASVAVAEYYHYTDENGVKHFTENISDIPEKFRPTVQINRTIYTPAGEEEQDSVIQQENSETQNPEAQNKDKMKRAELIAQKDALQNLYRTLQEKTEKLKARKETMKPEEYNILVEKLNEEIEDYHEKNKNYEHQVEEYNSQLKTASPEKEESSP